MNKLYYCLDCKRVMDLPYECKYCKSENMKVLGKNAPVNVIGSKLKGKVLNIKADEVSLLIRDDSKNCFIKSYKAESIRKIL